MKSEKDVSHHKNSIANSYAFQQYMYCVIRLRAYLHFHCKITRLHKIWALSQSLSLS